MGARPKRRRPNNSNQSHSPTETLLLLGFFGGSQTGETKKLRRWNWASLILLLISMMVIGAANGNLALSLIGTGFFALAFSILWWTWIRYVNSLDELQRTIQVKAFAFSYIIFVLLAGSAAAFLAAAELAIPAWDPLVTFFGVIVLPQELLRGIVLLVVARQYR